MTRLGLIYLDFWVGIGAQTMVMATYILMSRRLEERWNQWRVFFTLLAAVVIVWYAIGLTSQRGPSTDDTHLIFFSSVSALFILETVFAVRSAIVEFRKRKAGRHAARPE